MSRLCSPGQVALQSGSGVLLGEEGEVLSLSGGSTFEPTKGVGK